MMQDKETEGFATKLYESSLLSNSLGDILHPGGLKLTARMAETAEIRRSSLVLDLACGKGVTAWFLSQQYGCRVVGIDLSPKLLSLARGKYETDKLHFLKIVTS